MRWLFIFLLLAVGCGKSPSRTSLQELHLNLREEPPSLDPNKAMNLTSYLVLGQCYEGLMRLSEDNEPILAVAKEMQISDDGMRYTFVLKKARWSDGKPLTAKDFERSWKRMLDPLFPCEFAEELYILKGARSVKLGFESIDAVGVLAIDDQTLQIDLEYPLPEFPLYLAGHAFVPTSSRECVSNGPFKISVHDPQLRIVLEKNPYYWDRENVHLDKVHLAMVPDPSIELALFESGELDWAGSPFTDMPSEAIPSLKKKGVLHEYDFTCIYYYVFNTQQGLFQNASIRRALTLAISREQIINNIALLGQQPARGLLPPLVSGGGRNYFQDGDVTRAREEFAKGLSELGLSFKTLPPITLSYSSKGIHHQIVQAIQHQWQEALGISVNIESHEGKVYLDQLGSGQFQVAKWERLPSSADARLLLDDYRYEGNGKNRSRWSHPHYTELLDGVDSTLDVRKREALLLEAEELLMQEMPIAPIYFCRGAYLKQPYVKGIVISKLGLIDLKGAYIDEKESGHHRSL